MGFLTSEILKQIYSENKTEKPVCSYTSAKYGTFSSKKQKNLVEISYRNLILSNENNIRQKIKYEICSKKPISKEDKKKYSNKLSDFIIPGVGEISPNCNKWIPIKFCIECGNLILAKGNCNSPKCPNHSVKWRYKRTTSIFTRLYSHKLTNNARSGHIIISISDKDKNKLRTKDGYNKEKSKIIRFLRKKGVLGGALIYHPFRIIPEYKRQLYDIFSKTEDSALGEFALWKTLSKLVENWKDFVYFSPHFHIIGNYYFLQNAEKGEKYVFKRLYDFKYKNKSPLEEGIVRCSMYILSHAGISTVWHKQNVVWFGQLANNQWNIEKATEKIQEITYSWIKKLLNKFAETEDETHTECKICNGELHHILEVTKYIRNFDIFTQSFLKYAYEIAKGNKPPPISIKVVIKQ